MRTQKARGWHAHGLCCYHHWHPYSSPGPSRPQPRSCNLCPASSLRAGRGPQETLAHQTLTHPFLHQTLTRSLTCSQTSLPRLPLPPPSDTHTGLPPPDTQGLPPSLAQSPPSLTYPLLHRIPGTPSHGPRPIPLPRDRGLRKPTWASRVDASTALQGLGSLRIRQPPAARQGRTAGPEQRPGAGRRPGLG